ncbi:hypothetical protein BDQ12DRAFT_684802 [Crucibulum laeve]|uniref:F-box domain-containing protein n=1 Tax=Crucibulum laeve TaxID=68775 RepID=A0A5C3LY81_9AGAR|nr:hypothetical protein BDQ12DRAFT_684802 [Crucibulum laeve]
MPNPSVQQLPSEIIHTIVARVLADSLHRICFSTGNMKFELDALMTLSLVSHSFRAITLDVACKAFQLSETDIEKQPCLSIVQAIYLYLATFAAKFRVDAYDLDWSKTLTQQKFSWPSPVVLGYTLLVNSIALRRRTSSLKHPAGIFDITSKAIRLSLSRTEQICKFVRPEVMSTVLAGSVTREIKVFDCVTTIVESCRQLEEYGSLIKSYQFSDGVDNGPHTLTGNFHDALSKLENADALYSALCHREYGVEDCPIYNLPQTYHTIGQVHDITFPDDNYNLETRLRRLVKRWSAGCPFLNAGVN